MIAAEPVDVSAAPCCALGESPRWAAGRWWWLDVGDGRVWTSSDLRSQPELILRAGRRVSLVQPAGPDAAVVADGAVVRALRRRRGGGWELGEPVPLGLGPGWLLNDGCADIPGRLWLGAVPPADAAGRGLLMWTDGHEVTVARDGIASSNGMAWSTDGRTLLHADTGRKVLLAHQVDTAAGAVRNTAVVREFGDGLPDGVALDDRGGAWVAVYGTGQVRRIAPGEPDLTVTVPAAQVTSAALGGPDGRDMLITTAREGLGPLDDPMAGRLFRARAPHPGLPTALVNDSRWPT